MLQMRARGFRLHDSFPDVLGGMYLREEMMGATIEHDAAETPRVLAAVAEGSRNTAANNGGPPPPPGYDGHAAGRGGWST